MIHPTLPVSQFTAESNRVDVWYMPLEDWAGQLTQLEGTLSDDERGRADGYRFAQHRRSFVLGRGTLRRLLASYLNCRPIDVEFAYSDFGKPSVAGPDDSISFNVSRSGDWQLCAITRDRVLGVDVECIREDCDGDAIMNRFFSVDEQSQYWQIAADERRRAFFRGWTGKEAFVKALGRGLHQRLDHFRVPLAAGDPEFLRSTNDEMGDLSQWRIVDVSPDAETAASLVVDGGGWDLAASTWTPNAVLRPATV